MALTLMIAFYMIFSYNLVSAQQKFPAWMDEVEFSSPSRQGFSEPAMPIDPSTGQPATANPQKRGFRPELPDFSKMREKAMKIEMEKKQKAIDNLEQSHSMSVRNLEQLRRNKADLERLLAANPGDGERMHLLQGLKDIDERIKISEELLSLIGAENNATKPAQTIASLTADQFKRALQLQKQLFPPENDKEIRRPDPPSALTKTDKLPVLSDEEIEANAAKRRHRPYRPGRIKSFYLESKKSQTKAAEEGKNE